MIAEILNILPAPKQSYESVYDGERDTKEDTLVLNIAPASAVSTLKPVPPYTQRQNFIPYTVDDFGDGGAFPEIHIVQYPLEMGRPGRKSTAVVAVDLDEKGQVRFDAIVKQGTNKNKIVRSSLDDMKESSLPSTENNQLQLPPEEEEQSTADRTKKALEALLEGKIAKSKPSTIPNPHSSGKDTEEPTYVRYTPNPNAPGYNPAAKQRVIRMVEAQVDPMEPPKHKHKKVPRGPPSPPVPVLHSPPRKLTVKDQQEWKIPPCVSNWKNARGYTIPLDKRLAADGRGLQEVTINNKFAGLSESLYVAERKAGEELRLRNQLRKKMAMQEKENKEKDLRDMAMRARMERSGLAGTAGGSSAADKDEHLDYSKEAPSTGAAAGYGRDSRGREREVVSDEEGAGSDDREDSGGVGDDDPEELAARKERESLRIERRKEREREMRLDNMKGKLRQGKLQRDENRDVSEKIALGMLRGTAKLSGEAIYDSRLFNQSAGLDNGFGGDDEYNAYSKPLFDRGEAASVYRPKRDDADIYGDADAQLAKLKDTSKFKADKGFKGAEGGGGAPREAPVQFEKAHSREDRDRDDRRDDRDRDRDRSDRRRDRDRRDDRERDDYGDEKYGRVGRGSDEGRRRRDYDSDEDRHDRRHRSSHDGGDRGHGGGGSRDPFGIDDLVPSSSKRSRRS